MILDPTNFRTTKWYQLLYSTEVIIDPLIETEKRAISCSSIREWWDICPYPDWLLKYAAYQVDLNSELHKQIVRVSCVCARAVLHFVPMNENRPLLAIEATENWLRGHVSIEGIIEAGEASANYSLNGDLSGHRDYDKVASTAATSAAMAAGSTYTPTYAAYAASAAASCYTDVDEGTKQMTYVVRQHIQYPDQLEREFNRLLQLRVYW